MSHNAKANDIELGQDGPSEQVSRNTNEVHDPCPDDETDCQDSGQLQSPNNLDNKTATNVIPRDVEMNHTYTVSATDAVTEGGGFNALEKTNHPTPWSSCQTTRSDALFSAIVTSMADKTSSEKVSMDLT